VLIRLDSANPAVSSLMEHQLGRLPSLEESTAAARIANVTLTASLATARIFDLRHSFASFGAGAGMSLPVIGKPAHNEPDCIEALVA
jgi:hypothetical protein